MAAIVIRNVPPELHKRLKEEAARNRRSMTQQVLALLEEATSSRPPAPEPLPAPLKLGLPITKAMIDRAKRWGRA